MNKCPNCFYEFDSWNECVAINNILECPECEEHFELKAVPLNQPQLTIPKSVAESNWMKHLLNCDLSQFEFERYSPILDKEEQQFLKWANADKNENILYIYLASKALGVDLVKVVEDEVQETERIVL